MTTPSLELAALLAALGEIPGRVGALERQITGLVNEVSRFRAALPPALATIPVAAGALGVSVPTVRRWVKAGAVPTVKIGNTVRVDLSRLQGVDEVTVARLARSAAG